MMDVIVGTAGHIDHGKTALVRALTGIDTDRLPEEKKRGITVDLGFAEMNIGDVHFGFVDVPGHERFVKNMLAGASGIDIVLLVIAADEGVMPQTREHFDICRLLNVRTGVIALTKSDLVDAETLELAKLDAAELVTNSFLMGAPVIDVSSATGAGIGHLKEALTRQAASLPVRDDRLVTYFPIDRSFSMRGFGAVVTGTLVSGEINEGGELELLPAGRRVRVRGLQTHGTSVKTAVAGTRVALNLAGIEHSEITRGMVLAEPGVLKPTQIIDAEIETLSDIAKPLRTRQRVRVSIGTNEELARIQVLDRDGEIAGGQKDLAQIRFERPVVAAAGERFIIRSYSPQRTIAGGTVIDPLAAKHRIREFDLIRDHMREIASAAGDPAGVLLLVDRAGNEGVSFEQLQSRTALKREILISAIEANIAERSVVAAGSRFVASESFSNLIKTAETAIEEFHKREPLAKGISRESLRDRLARAFPQDVFTAAIAELVSSGTIVVEKDTIRLRTHKSELAPEEVALSEKILDIYADARFEPPRLDEALDRAAEGVQFSRGQPRKLFQQHLDAGKIVKVTDEFYFHAKSIDDLAKMLKDFAAKTNDRVIDVAKFKELAGVSRKYAIPLLEYFDREKVTARVRDKRMIL